MKGGGKGLNDEYLIILNILGLQISSDFLATQKVFYRISGVGADQPPLGIFIVDRNTGEINITSVVDREKTPSFQVRFQHWTIRRDTLLVRGNIISLSNLPTNNSICTSTYDFLFPEGIHQENVRVNSEIHHHFVIISFI